jgi:hypothetical protein
METTKVEVYKSGKDEGYLGTNQHWWFDPTFENAFSIFDIDSFYPDEYFKNDHVGSYVIRNYITAVLEYGQLFLGRDVKTIIEFGSGGGWFTESFLERNIEIIGVEGTTAGYKKCLQRGIPSEKIIKHDIRRPLNLNKKFDMALCTEVAEHIEPPFSSQLITNLINHSSLIWFSFEEPDTNAAHYHHCNEQPAIFWKNLFAFYGYSVEPLPSDLTKALSDRGRFICYSTKELSLPKDLSHYNYLNPK